MISLNLVVIVNHISMVSFLFGYLTKELHETRDDVMN